MTVDEPERGIPEVEDDELVRAMDEAYTGESVSMEEIRAILRGPGGS